MIVVRFCAALMVAMISCLNGAVAEVPVAIPPTIPDSFAQPEGWTEGRLDSGETGLLRYGYAPATDGDASRVAVLVAGAGSPIEKYWEITNDLNDQGYDVWQIDWPGHGLSPRLADNPMMLHIDDFAQYVSVLHLFMTDVVRPASAGKSVILWANSMGGNIALRYLHDHPGIVQASVMSAPMFRMNTGGVPDWIYRAIAFGGRFVGLDKEYAPGGGDWAYNPEATMEALNSSHDPNRFDVLEELFHHNPQLVNSWPSIGWLAAAIETTDLIFGDGYAEAIRDPFLVMSPQQDNWVMPEAHKVITDRSDAGSLMILPDLMHEPWFDKDAVREDLFARVETWLSDKGL